MAADRHAHQPVTVRPSAGPGGDRAWLLAYAAHAGIAEGKPEMAVLRAMIMVAVAEFRASHAAEMHVRTCICDCGCPRTGRADDDGAPGWCDACRMNIHRGS